MSAIVGPLICGAGLLGNLLSLITWMRPQLRSSTARWLQGQVCACVCVRVCVCAVGRVCGCVLVCLFVRSCVWLCGWLFDWLIVCVWWGVVCVWLRVCLIA